MSARRMHCTRAGLTLIELVLALALLSLLMLAVFQLLDRSLSLWRRVETRRSLLEQASAVADQLAHDLRSLDNGGGGDLVAEWVRFDTDGDGTAETKWPRLRLVRQASAAEIARIPGDVASAKSKDKQPSDEQAKFERASPGLVEVVWLVVPASLHDKDALSEGILWRGERRVDEVASKSFLAGDFFGTSNRPPAGATEEVTGGLLWMQVLFAGQTSVVHDGWNMTKGQDSVVASWDAWSRKRPDADLHPWNAPMDGAPKAKDLPLLPRRVRIELEFERPIDRLRRTTLLDPIDTSESGLRVDDPDRVPREEESFVLVDAEWMRVTAVDGKIVAVKRGERGTTPAHHAAGAMLHYGLKLVREAPIALYRDKWDS